MGAEWFIPLLVVTVVFFTFFSKLVWKPVKWIGYVGVHLVIGGLLLFLFNIIGERIGMYIPINPATALIIGFLRLPGLMSLIAIKLLILN